MGLWHVYVLIIVNIYLDYGVEGSLAYSKVDIYFWAVE